MKVAINNWWRFFFGLSLGPLIALYLIPLGNCALVPFTGSSNCWAGITGFTWYGLPIAGFAIVTAFPLILLALRAGWTRWGQYVFAGAVIAAAIGGVLALLDRSLNPAALLLGITPLGSVAALIFWLVAIRRNVN